MSTAATRTALWAPVHLEHGDVKHVRIRVSVITVTAAQAYLGLGA